MENILHGEEARDKLLLGVNKVANAIKGTLGANAGTVIIQNPAGLPLILNDGVSITKSITDPDPYIQMGINLMQEVAHEAQSKSGDGTTTATILAQALCNTMADDDTDNIKIKETLNTMCKYIVSELKDMATDVNDDDLLDVCIVASNNDVELGRLIHQALLAVGEEGNVIIETNSDNTTTWSLTEGLVMDSGYVNKLMANADREKCIYDNASILLTQEKIDTFNHIVPALELSMKAGKPLVVVCHDYNPSILPNCIVKTAGFGDTQDHWLQDIEAKCGGKVFNSFDSIITVKEHELGVCDKVEITSTTSTFIKDGVDEDYIDNLTSILTQVKTDFEREIVENRIARLTSGIASIKVGGITDIEQRERRERVDDAVNAATLARKQGIVSGGGVALKDIWWKTQETVDKMDGIIYFDAILAPIKQILSNSGQPTSNLAYAKSKGEGYDAVSRKYCNLRFHGIIDPVGVSINAVESAFSIAILLLTTDCAIIAPQE